MKYWWFIDYLYEDDKIEFGILQNIAVTNLKQTSILKVLYVLGIHKMKPL